MHALRWIRAGSVIGACALLLALGSTPVAAGTPITVYSYVGGCSVGGTATPSTSYVVTIRNAEHELKWRQTVMTNGSGSFYTSCFPGGYTEANDTVKVAGPTTRTVTIRRLTAVADRVADTVSGKAAPNSTVYVNVQHCHLVGNQCTTSKSKAAPTDAAGQYTAAFTAFDPQGGDSLFVNWTSPEGDGRYLYGAFPYLEVWQNQAETVGASRSGALVTTTLRSSGNTLRGTARDVIYSPGTYFYSSFRNADDDPVYVHATDKIASDIASDAHFAMPSVTISGNAATNVISGDCLASSPFQVNAADPTGSRPDSYTTAFGTTDAGGNFSVNVTTNDPTFNLSPGDSMEVICERVTGDVVGRRGSIAP